MRPRLRTAPRLTLFVTVGSTRFDKLVDKILSEECGSLLSRLGFARLILQVGNSQYDSKQVENLKDLYKFDIEIYDYKSSIKPDMEKAHLVVGHAGAGTCLEALRLHKKLLIVTNEALMDNHQSELADQLSKDNYVVQTTVDKFNESLEIVCDSERTKLDEFPSRDASKFEEIFNEALRKVSSRL